MSELNPSKLVMPYQALHPDVNTVVSVHGEDLITSHQKAIDEITGQVENAREVGVFTDEVADFVQTSLLSQTARQANYNNKIYWLHRNRKSAKRSTRKDHVSEEVWQRAWHVNAAPSALAHLAFEIRSNQGVEAGVEIARRTHIGRWDIETDFDKPVIASLVNDTVLQTRIVEGSQPYYKPEHADGSGHRITVVRKKLEATHLGDPYGTSPDEKLWSIRRTSMLIDKQRAKTASDKKTARAIVRLAHEMGELGPRDPERAAIHSQLADEMNDVVTLPIDSMPQWIIPEQTTIYTTAKPLNYLLKTES